jgi:tetratricopeptide (TPR) repeat protein
MILRWLLLSLFAMSAAMAINYGDNGLGYPKVTSFLQGYYEVNYSQAYFNLGGHNTLKDSVGVRYQLSDDLLLGFEKKYMSNKVAFGLQTQFFAGFDIGVVGIGARNLGMSYADTNSPYGQEFATYMFEAAKMNLTVGIQRMVNNGADFLDVILGAKTSLLGRLDVDVFYENRSLGIGLSFPWDDRLKISLVGLAPSPTQVGGDFRNAEMTFTWFMQPSKPRASLDTFGRTPLESYRSKDSDRQLSLLQARLSAIEYMYSETFQQKLLGELLSQRLIDRKFTDEETDRLKTTLQHVQKGFEYYYLRDYQKAYEEYKLANSIYPNLPVVHASLGSLQLAMGRLEEAKQEWLLWLSLAPDSDEAKASLQKLEKEHPELFSGKGASK